MAGYPRSLMVLIIAAPVGLVALGGCHPPPPVYIVEAAPQQLVVPHQPPAAHEQIRPPQPEDGYVWIEGYWHWDGNEYHWVDGEWSPPRDGYSYYASNYYFINNMWMYQAGYWYPTHMPHLGPGRHHGDGRDRGHAKGQGQGKPHTPGKARVSAPPAHKDAASTPNKVRTSAPPAATGQDPDKVHDPKAGGAWSKKQKRDGKKKKGSGGDHLPAYDDGDERMKVKRSARGPRAQYLRKRADYRGTEKGRMVFSNIPDGKETDDVPQKRAQAAHGYPTDRTGAIVLKPDEKGGWKPAARVPPGGHRPDPSVVEVHTGDPRMKVRVRRHGAEAEGTRVEAKKEKQARRRPRVKIDTRQRTHYRPAPRKPATTRQPTVIYSNGYRRVRQNPYRAHTRPRPRHRPRVVNRRPVQRRAVQRPPPPRVVHRPTPRPVSPRPSPPPRRVIVQPKTQKRPAPAPTPERRKRRR